MKKVLPILLLTSFYVSTANAQQPQVSPDQMEQMMQRQMQMMGPMFGEMTRIMMQAQFEVLAKPETAEKLAAYTRNYYNALVKQGFSKQEALEIAMNIGIPSAPMMGK